MFNLGFLKECRQKGALFVEYALILAFVVAAGLVFLGEGSFKDSIASIFGKTGETLEVAVNGGEKKEPAIDVFGKFVTDMFSNDDKFSKIMNKGSVITSDTVPDDKRQYFPETMEGNWVMQWTDNGYHTAWTDVDISKIEGKSTVKVIEYEGGDKGGYYIRYYQVENGSFKVSTNGDKSSVGYYTQAGTYTKDFDTIKKTYNSYDDTKNYTW